MAELHTAAAVHAQRAALVFALAAAAVVVVLALSVLC
jgi:hypothetical protein